MNKNSNTHYSTAMLPVKRFNWIRFIKNIIILSVVIGIIFFPYQIGEIFGKWLELLTSGFKNSFK